MSEQWAIVLAGAIIALQSWILLEIVRLKVSVSRGDTQLNRIVSEIESEKGTRKRLHADFERRLRTLELHLPPAP